MKSRMDIISQFMENYKKKISFYETAGHVAEDMLRDALHSSGIRAIVTSRAKSPVRLKNKVTQRNEKREQPYRSMNEIYADIADLSGVRVSLYFPGDRAKADQVINNLFTVSETKKFPGQSKQPSYNKRFSGYWATHYRASMKEELLEKKQLKYVSVRLEIQVASVLMHAWSEVEHDLVYKPMQGTLSDEELAILDELNGLVLAGEIALERLQSAGNARLQSKNAAFGSQYDLAAYLYDYLSTRYKRFDIEPKMGNVEQLLRLMNRLKLDSARELDPILKATRLVDDRRTIAQQLTDQIICGNEKRYALYLELRAASEKGDASSQKPDKRRMEAVEYFLRPWISLEAVLMKLTSRNNPRARGTFNLNSIKRLKLLEKNSLEKLQTLRAFRNGLVHGIDNPSPASLIKMGEAVREILSELNEAQANQENQAFMASRTATSSSSPIT